MEGMLDEATDLLLTLERTDLLPRVEFMLLLELMLLFPFLAGVGGPGLE